jgi:TolA-binding protein
MSNRITIITLALAFWCASVTSQAEVRPAASVAQQERAAIANEIRSELLYDSARAAATAKELMESDAQTATAVVQAAASAFARVDKRFAAALDLLEQKQFSKSADAFYHLINPLSRPLFAATAQYHRARAISQQGGDEDLEKAAEQFEELAEKMQMHPAFALAAHLEAARLHDRLHRFLYAADRYQSALKIAEETGLATDAERKEAGERLAQLRGVAEDPLGAVASSMQAAHGFLGENETGARPQTKQQEAIALLDDLIKTLQDQQQQQENQQQQQQQQNEQQRAQQQRQQGRAQRALAQPTSPARVSALPPGATTPAGEQAPVHPTDETDAWGRLKQAERERILQDLKERFPDRYQEMLREYFIDLGSRREP